MNLSRRRMLAISASLPVLAGPARSPAADGPVDAAKSKLIILGTGGGPNVGGPRYMTSHVIVCGDDAYVVDCGYGVTEQLVRAHVPLANIRDVFITHHHPDHDIETGTLIYFAWYNGLKTPLDLYGGPPLKQIVADYMAAQKPDVDIWVQDIDHTPMPPIRVHEISQGGPVMADAKVKVTAAVVHHPPVTPAFAYRFDMADRSIVFSGDTSPVQAVVDLARGADILVHEAIDLDTVRARPRPTPKPGAPAPTVDFDKLMQHLASSHTSTEEVGRIAQEAGVKTLVLSHLSPGADTIPDAVWSEKAARHFTGKIIVAHDLMVL